MIRAKNIHFSYDKLNVLNGVNLDIKKGEFVSIVGASGAGKSTLLNLIGTLERMQLGSLTINNKDIINLNEIELAKIRNKEIGFIFQFHNLLNEFTALENICLPAFLNGTTKETAEKKGMELLSMLNLHHKSENKPDELSGGEQQRVAVARSLINSPSILLADEPSGNLDSRNASELHELLLKLNKETSQTIIVITHSKELAKLADKTYEIKDGKII